MRHPRGGDGCGRGSNLESSRLLPRPDAVFRLCLGRSRCIAVDGMSRWRLGDHACGLRGSFPGYSLVGECMQEEGRPGCSHFGVVRGC